MTSAIRARREAEDGFTLIELLVVVIIIGILAAIAIPAFLNQRERAWQSELTSAVRNSALEIEAEATQNGGTYPLTAAGAPVVYQFVDANISDADAATDPAVVADAVADSPIAGITYTGDATGFTICMSHDSIAGNHNVTYLGGDRGNGVQDFAEATC